jgi:hypothetical protein
MGVTKESVLLLIKAAGAFKFHGNTLYTIKKSVFNDMDQ